MLEKIGLPAKPSLRGSNWVVDASHCQGCSSQFTFINRKHHCRRCGGIFCNSCTQQRMILRGQGDSPVRICEPCKKLEEAARFELRYGHKGRAGKGSSKISLKDDDEILNQILGTNVKDSYSSGQRSSRSMNSSSESATNSASCSSTQDAAADSMLQDETTSASPEELRQQAVEEKKQYKILKGKGKPEEALRAFKRGKELERQAEALEISIRRNRKRALSSRNSDDILNKDGNKESSRTDKHSRKVGKEKDDLVAELRELGWSDMDLHSEDQKPIPTSLESELSSLLGDVSQRTGKDVGARGIDKTPVIALKRKALALKREGKLAEAKEELKKAKVLEKQLEEQEILGEEEDSDDELSGIIASMDDDEQDELSIQYKQEPDFSFDHLLGTANDLAESNFEVTDEDMEDPEITSALKSLGWAEDINNIENIIPQSTPLDRESLSREILSLKREALNQKRTGNVGEAMAALKKAKLLEKDLERFEPQDSLSTTVEVNHGDIDFPDLDSKVGRRSKLMIQKELLAMKKKALALRREGKLHEAEEELKKSKILEQELEEMNNDSKAKATGNKDLDLAHELPVISRNLSTEEVEADVTDQDLHDPAYLSALKNLGWDEESEVASNPQKSSQRKDDLSAKMNNSVLTQAAPDIPTRAPKRSKAEIQRELLNLKRKALSLRRQGLTDEAEEVLKMAKVLEAQLADLDAPREAQMEDAQISKENLMAKAGENPGSVSTPVFSNDQVVESTQLVKDDRPPLLGTADVSGFHGGIGGAQPSGFAPQPVQSANLTDLLTGDSWSSSPVPSVQLDSFPNLHEDGGNRNETKIENIEEKMKNAHENLHGNDTSPILGSASSGDQTSLRQEVLACKKKAVALKREGKLAEAREELRHAKLLEKSLEEDGIKPRTIQLEASVTTSRTTSDQQKELDASISAPKFPLSAPKPPLSSRDRFKLQQESLSHKRQALKLRREGRMDEAEALFEKAKVLEAQLDDSSANVGKNTDVVEDLLDPQLLSALKAIGLDDTNVAQQPHHPQRSEPVKSQRPERTEPVKLSPEKTQKIENSSPERAQLEEKIKTEKIKAVNFKRSGKQTEALEALRRAKLFEKKLSSLT